MNLVAELKRRQERERAALLDEQAVEERIEEGAARDGGRPTFNEQRYERTPIRGRWDEEDRR